MTPPPSAIEIVIDTGIFRLAAVKKAAYRFGDRCHVAMDSADQSGVVVRLTPKNGAISAAALEGEFRNEVLDQELREVVADETLPVRNLLLAQAFSATSLLDPAGESGDYHDDPLGIRSSS